MKMVTGTMNWIYLYDQGNNSKQNYSKAHLTLLSKLGLDIDISQCEQLAGNTEPSIRMVVRD